MRPVELVVLSDGEEASERKVNAVTAARPSAPMNWAVLASSPPGAFTASRSRLVPPEEGGGALEVDTFLVPPPTRWGAATAAAAALVALAEVAAMAAPEPGLGPRPTKMLASSARAPPPATRATLPASAGVMGSSTAGAPEGLLLGFGAEKGFGVAKGLGAAAGLGADEGFCWKKEPKPAANHMEQGVGMIKG